MVELADKIADEVAPLLRAAAEQRRFLTYDQVSRALHRREAFPSSSTLHAALRRVSERSFEEYGFVLSALVMINVKENHPGEGFADMARDLGLPHADEDVTLAWVHQFQKIFRLYGLGVPRWPVN
jgi:hypothetical protein